MKSILVCGASGQGRRCWIRWLIRTGLIRKSVAIRTQYELIDFRSTSKEKKEEEAEEGGKNHSYSWIHVHAQMFCVLCLVIVLCVIFKESSRWW